MEYKTLKSAQDAAGKISLGNGKMPGSTFPISATKCKVGGKLADVKGSVCNRCYALKLEKLRPSVNQGWLANYTKSTNLIDTNPDAWVAACLFQIKRAYLKSGQPFHRWFDSGDLQSVAMLSAICKVAMGSPEISHWLPTRESAIVKLYRANGGSVPSNLVIRVSSTMVNDNPIANHVNTSTVHGKNSNHWGHACPASSPEHKAMDAGGKSNCGDCRACWNPAIANISYPLH